MCMKRLLNATLLIFLLSGCGATYHYAEFIKPSKVYVPARIYYVGLINRGASPLNTTAIQIDGIEYEHIEGLPLKAAEKTVGFWKTEIEKIGRYEITEIEWDDSIRDPKLFMAKELSEHVIDSLCELYDVDAIVSLDGLEMTIKTNGNVDVMTTTDDAGMPVRVPEFSRQQEVAMTTAWRFYDGYTLKKVNQYQESYRRIFNQITADPGTDKPNDPTDMSLTGVAETAAYDYLEQISPFWEEDYRLYYRGHTNDLLIISDNLEYNGNWEKAAKKWKLLIDHKDPKVQYYSRYNMAVASEMLGSPKAAKEWLLKAKEVNHIKQVDKYMEIIDRQIIIYEVVDRQLGLQ